MQRQKKVKGRKTFTSSENKDFVKTIKNILRLIVFLPLILVFNSIIRANDDWIQVRSKNFYLIGNADEKDIKQAAIKLEEFRAALSRVLDQYNFNSPVPTTTGISTRFIPQANFTC